jgi:hypothetical protein
MLGSFERLHVGNALTFIEETLRSGHRLKLEYILGTFCERISKKCGHAGLSAKILHICPCDRAREHCTDYLLASGSLLVAQGCNFQLHIRRGCAPILTGSHSWLSDTLGCAAIGHAQLSK